MSNVITYSKESFEKVIPRMMEAGLDKQKVVREVSFALQIVNRNPYLLKCDKSTILESVLNIANIGLTLNPAAREAALVPRWNSGKKITECTLVPQYIGLVKLITNTGKVRSLVTNVVYEKDRFEINLADNKSPVLHNPELIRNRRGEMIGAYSVATLPDGTRQVEWMEKETIDHIRDFSESYRRDVNKNTKHSPWTNHYNEMARKTVIKRLYKYLPRGENENIDSAIELENQDYGAASWQLLQIEGLLDNANVPSSTTTDIQNAMMEDITYQKAQNIIGFLKENQLAGTIENTGGAGHLVKTDKVGADSLSKLVEDKVDDPKS